MGGGGRRGWCTFTRLCTDVAVLDVEFALMIIFYGGSDGINTEATVPLSLLPATLFII